MKHFLYRAMSSSMPAAYHTRSFSNGLPLWGLSIVLVCHSSNFCTCQFIVDFVKCSAHHTPPCTFSCEFHYPKYFLETKTDSTSLFSPGHRCQCCCHHYFSLHRVISNWFLQNFTYVLGIPSETCAHSFDATMLSHAENGWKAQNSFEAPFTQLCFEIKIGTALYRIIRPNFQECHEVSIGFEGVSGLFNVTQRDLKISILHVSQHCWACHTSVKSIVSCKEVLDAKM